MPRFAANLSMMFHEWSFLDRFAAAAGAGFEAVEFLFPYDYAPEEIAARLESNNLTLVNFNLPPGNWGAGERGTAALPGREKEFRAGLDHALVYARATGAARMHAMAGLAPAADAEAQRTYAANLALAAERCATAGVDLLIEPLNPRDVPGYFLCDFGRALALIRTLALPNLKLQFDIYHRQILHGDVAKGLREAIPSIGHVQIAGVPDRHEPDCGELDFAFVCGELDRLGYAGHVGCEYRPRSGTLEGLGWFTPYATFA